MNIRSFAVNSWTVGPKLYTFAAATQLPANKSGSAFRIFCFWMSSDLTVSGFLEILLQLRHNIQAISVRIIKFVLPVYFPTSLFNLGCFLSQLQNQFGGLNLGTNSFGGFVPASTRVEQVQQVPLKPTEPSGATWATGALTPQPAAATTAAAPTATAATTNQDILGLW